MLLVSSMHALCCGFMYRSMYSQLYHFIYLFNPSLLLLLYDLNFVIVCIQLKGRRRRATGKIELFETDRRTDRRHLGIIVQGVIPADFSRRPGQVRGAPLRPHGRRKTLAE